MQEPEPWIRWFGRSLRIRPVRTIILAALFVWSRFTCYYQSFWCSHCSIRWPCSLFAYLVVLALVITTRPLYISFSPIIFYVSNVSSFFCASVCLQLQTSKLLSIFKRIIFQNVSYLQLDPFFRSLRFYFSSLLNLYRCTVYPHFLARAHCLSRIARDIVGHSIETLSHDLPSLNPLDRMLCSPFSLVVRFSISTSRDKCLGARLSLLYVQNGQLLRLTIVAGAPAPWSTFLVY